MHIKVHRAHPILRIVHTLISLGRVSSPFSNWTEGRGIVPSIFIPFRSSFEEMWPILRWTERPRDYPVTALSGTLYDRWAFVVL